jgi:propanol-preferring alcohol dehydrogenase
VRPGDRAAENFALALGAVWAGSFTAAPPEPLDAALIFAPVGALVPAALRATAKGRTVVCARVHMSDIPAFSYRLLWEERIVRSVAPRRRRVSRPGAEAGVKTEIETFPLAQANAAFARLRGGQLRGAAVLVP